MNRYISSQVLLNKDMSMKAQRVYSIPMPSVVSFYLVGTDADGHMVTIGVLVQDWKSRDCLDFHPDMKALEETLCKHFGFWLMGVQDAK